MAQVAALVVVAGMGAMLLFVGLSFRRRAPGRPAVYGMMAIGLVQLGSAVIFLLGLAL